MSIQKQELYTMIENLPEELSNKVIDYIEYLRFSYAVDKAPSNLVIKSKQDLLEKLEEGIKDTEQGKVCSLEEAFAEVENILEN